MDRCRALVILGACIAAGAHLRQLATLLEMELFTLQRWRRQIAAVGHSIDRRKGRPRMLSYRLSDEERLQVFLICN